MQNSEIKDNIPVIERETISKEDFYRINPSSNELDADALDIEEFEKYE